jgi:phosphate transport system protein
MSKEKFSAEFDRLIGDVQRMADHAMSMLAGGLAAFVEQDMDLARSVYEKKAKLDFFDRDIEERALLLLTLHQPMARDLRTIACILKMDTYLNRVGRYGKDIAKDALNMGDRPHIAKLVNIPHQHEIVSGMLKDVVRAFNDNDGSLIHDISERDDQVDAIWDSVFRECITYMMEDPKNITPCIHYIMVSRHLERCGDHACKIAEKVHYKITGEHIEIK